MSEQLFDVVFFGILQADKDREVVMQNMATLFKTDASKLAPYFAGGRKVIKGKVGAATAEKYQAALENVGLVIKLEACESVQDEADTEQDNHQQTDLSAFSVAPVGSDIIESPTQVMAQKIANISAITLAEAGADVIENPAEVTPQKIEDISDITMAEIGSDVMEHPVEVITQEIEDISGISLAEAGADMIANPKPKVSADIPDTSELSLDNISD